MTSLANVRVVLVALARSGVRSTCDVSRARQSGAANHTRRETYARPDAALPAVWSWAPVRRLREFAAHRGHHFDGTLARWRLDSELIPRGRALGIHRGIFAGVDVGGVFGNQTRQEP